MALFLPAPVRTRPFVYPPGYRWSAGRIGQGRQAALVATDQNVHMRRNPHASCDLVLLIERYTFIHSLSDARSTARKRRADREEETDGKVNGSSERKGTREAGG